MENGRELEIKNSFIEYLDFLIKGLEGIDYNKVRGKNCYADSGTVVFYKLFIGQLISRIKDIKSKITISDILGHSTIEEFHKYESVVIPMKDRFQKIQTDISASHSNFQKFRNKPIVLGDGYIANVSGYQEDYSISIFNKSITSPETRIINGKILDYRIVRRWISEDDSMQIEHEIIIFNPISNLKYITHLEEIADEVIDDEPTDVDTEVAKVDVKSVKTDISDTTHDRRLKKMKKRREFEIKHTFIKYLNFLIKDFKGIDYNKVRCEDSDIEFLAKDFVKDLTKLLTVLKTKVTITDILGHVEVEEFADDMPVSIIVDTRFQKLTIPDNLIDLRKLTIDLGNNYTITAQGDRDNIAIIIKNKTITSPKLKDENPGGTILFYSIEKIVDYDGDLLYYRHTIQIDNPIANMNFINHYMANLNFIKRYEESGDDELVETDDEDDVESAETDIETCEEKDNFSDDRELVFKNQFVEYLDHLVSAFKAINYDQVQRENSHTNGGARVVFYKDIVNQIIKLLIDLKSKVTIRDVVGEQKYFKFTSISGVDIMITGRFPEISMPAGWNQYFLKELRLGNGYEIGMYGIPKECEIYIRNSNISSPRANRYNLKCNIIGYKIYQVYDSEGHATGFEHSIIFYSPIANLRFIKGYPDDDDPVETDVEVDENDEDDDTEWDVEEDDFPPDDWFPSDKREEESDRTTESIQSDNNKTLNFSLPGPNGTKMSINLNINITFE